MSAVRDTSRPHTTTVTQASKNALNGKTRKRKPPACLPVNKPLVTRIDADVLATAKRLAGDDLTRLRMNPDGSVLVVNRGRRA